MVFTNYEVTNMSIQVFAFIIALTLMLSQGCSDPNVLQPEDEIKTGEIFPTPWGCIELREQVKNAEC